tara:strand:+ start:1336 stop:1596 length:261 start_codon:yes stop_codon:yes gene_type:complete
LIFNKKKKVVYHGMLDCFTIIAFVQYLEQFESVYNTLVSKGKLPPEDKFLREEFIKAFKRGELVDIVMLQEEADRIRKFKIRKEVN